MITYQQILDYGNSLPQDVKTALGPVQSTEMITLDGGMVGYCNYSNGAIYYMNTWADNNWQVIYGLIYQKWCALGREQSVLGYPVSQKEENAGSGRGRYVNFQNGTIIWKSGDAEAFAVYSGIYAKWGSTGYDSGFLGFPQSDETGTPDLFGRYNHFEGGSIYWTPITAEHIVQGAIRNEWASQGWEQSMLGYPTSDELVTEGTNGTGRHSNFQGGVIYWTPENGAVIHLNPPDTNIGIMPLNTISWHNRNASDHEDLTNTNLAKGYRFLTLSIYGDTIDPFYAAVMILRPTIIAQKAFFKQSTQEFQQLLGDLSMQGYHPVIVSATGPANNPFIAAVFQMTGTQPVVHFNLTETDMCKINDQQFLDGNILHWVDAYGDETDTRYIAIWYSNPSKIGWNAGSRQYAFNVSQQEAQNNFNAITSAGPSLRHIAFTPKPGFLQVFADEIIGTSWHAQANMTSEQYQALSDDMASKGIVAVRLSAQGSGSDARFAAIFSNLDRPQPRIFRMRGIEGMAPNQDIDNAMKTYMMEQGLYGSSLAIVKDTKLVYAAGYTYAGRSYPDVLPTTLFRQGSCSKTITAIALYRYIQTNALSTIDDTIDLVKMQDILALDPPPGRSLATNFDKITLRHLLESTSGLETVDDEKPNISSADLKTKEAFNTTFPVTLKQLASYGATLNLINQPGDTKSVHYGNAAYFYLSLVLSVLHNNNATEYDLEEAIKVLLMDPLQMTRIRRSRTFIGDQLADEARYHVSNLELAKSLRTNDQPMLHKAYGLEIVENYVGEGGLSAAVVDMARLIAMLNVKVNNPVLNNESIDTLFKNATYATHNYQSPPSPPGPQNQFHGFHGWDIMNLIDESKKEYWGRKGGDITGIQTFIDFTSGGFTFINAINENITDTTGVPWPDIAAAIEWGDTDLFPLFDMPSFQ